MNFRKIQLLFFNIIAKTAFTSVTPRRSKSGFDFSRTATAQRVRSSASLAFARGIERQSVRPGGVWHGAQRPPAGPVAVSAAPRRPSFWPVPVARGQSSAIGLRASLPVWFAPQRPSSGQSGGGTRLRVGRWGLCHTTTRLNARRFAPCQPPPWALAAHFQASPLRPPSRHRLAAPAAVFPTKMTLCHEASPLGCD